jgi:hypothetical protein
MIYLAAGLAVYLIITLLTASFSMAAGLVLLSIGLVFGGAFAASMQG